MSVLLKTCARCGTPKEEQAFKMEARGRRTVCIECTNLRRRENRAADPEKFRSCERARWKTLPLTKRQEYRANRDPRRQMLYNAKQNSKSRGLECSITLDDIQIPDVCPVFGTAFVFGQGKKRRSPLSPSIDRIDNRRGYVPGNVAVISWRANDMKGNATATDLEAILAYIRSRT